MYDHVMSLREVAIASVSSVGRMKAMSLTKAEANVDDTVPYKGRRLPGPMDNQSPSFRRGIVFTIL